MKGIMVAIWMVMLFGMALASLDYTAFKTQTDVFVQVTNNVDHTVDYSYLVYAKFDTGDYTKYGETELAPGQVYTIQIPRNGFLIDLQVKRYDQASGGFVLDFETNETGLLVHDVSTSLDFNSTQRCLSLSVENDGDFNETVNITLRNTDMNLSYSDTWEIDSGVGYSECYLVPPGNYSADAEIDYDYNTSNNIASAYVPEIVDLALNASLDGSNLIIVVTNDGNVDTPFNVTVNGEEIISGVVGIGESINYTYTLSSPGNYTVVVNAEGDVDPSNNQATIQYSPSGDLAIKRIFITGAEAHAIVFNGFDKTVDADVEIDLVYSSGTREYGTNLSLDPGDNDVYAPITDGYLISIVAVVDPNNTVTPPSDEKRMEEQVNEYFDSSPPAIWINRTCKNTRVGEPCPIRFEVYDQELSKYWIMSDESGEFENKTWYAHASDIIVDYNLTFTKSGFGHFKIFAEDSSGNIAETDLFTVNVNQEINESTTDIVGIAHYTGALDIWRDYHYNRISDKTLIRNRITSRVGGKVEMTDWIPLPITQGNYVYVSGNYTGTKTRPVFTFDFSPGDTETIDYVVSGRVDPRLVKDMPAPKVEVVSGSQNQSMSPKRAKREYHVGNFTITRTWEFMPNSNITLIMTTVSGLENDSEYTISDSIAKLKDHDVVIFPEPDEKLNYTLTWNVSNLSNFTYAYRVNVYIPSTILDNLSLPTINKVNETSGEKKKKPVELPSKITGLVSLIENGSLTYAGMVILASIVAVYIAYREREKKAVEEGKPEEVQMDIFDEITNDIGFA